jgi:hypothetical protein
MQVRGISSFVYCISVVNVSYNTLQYWKYLYYKRQPSEAKCRKKESVKGEGSGKEVPQHSYGGAEWDRRYSSYSFTTPALDRGEWSASRPGPDLPSGKGPPVPIVQGAGWATELVWIQRLQEKSFAPAGDRTPIARSSSP